MAIAVNRFSPTVRAAAARAVRGRILHHSGGTMATMKELLRDALLRLAASAHDQEAYWRLGTAPLTDELAIEFSDALHVLLDGLDQDSRTAAPRLDRYLEEISGSQHAGIWTVDALHTAPEWASVRLLAREALRVLE